KIVFGDSLHRPCLETEPPVTGWIVEYRLEVKGHSVEGGKDCRRGKISALPAIGGASRDAALHGLQPTVELEHPVQARAPVSGAICRERLKSCNRGKRKSGKWVLVAKVAGARSNPPRPAAIGSIRSRAAPCVVPREQEVRGVITRSGRTIDVRAAELL